MEMLSFGSEEELDNEIEKLRLELNSLGETVGLDNENILKLSQQLDGHILQSMRLKSQKKLNGSVAQTTDPEA